MGCLLNGAFLCLNLWRGFTEFTGYEMVWLGWMGWDEGEGRKGG